ncbi:MAG TPA: Uma2 family endonuclease [Thermomicrobiales bacterium]|nr:Uma2 family endonuclease [Thermomicrobiales bacterium]
MATTKLMTIDDLWETEEPGRYDLIRGELHATAPAGKEHGDTEMNLLLALGTHVREHRLGRVYPGDTGFVLSREANTLLSPDVAFVRRDRLPREYHPAFFPFSPDFAVEVLSPSDRSSEVTEKVMEYLAAGTSLVWVVDPRLRVVIAHTPDRGARTYSDTDTIDCGDVIPGFQIHVADIFNSLP